MRGAYQKTRNKLLSLEKKTYLRSAKTYIMQSTDRVLRKKYREYLLPTILTSMATQFASLVDSVMASNLVCSKGIAAISIIAPIQQLLYAITIIFGLGATSMISKALGEGDRTKANHLFTLSFLSVCAISLLAVAVQLPFVDGFSRIFTDDVELQRLTRDFYIPFICGIPVYMLLFCGVHAVRTDGRPKYASAIMIIANAVNLTLDYVLMGIFSLGMTGASIATVSGNLVGLAMILAHYAQGRSQVRFTFGASLHRNVALSTISHVFTTGVSGAMGALFIVLRLQFFISIITAISGACGLVAFSLCTGVTRLISMFIAGASQAMIPIVALCMGEHDYQGVRYTLRRAMQVLGWASVVIMLYFFALPDTFIELYGITDAMERVTSRTAIVITAFSIPGEAFLFLFLYYFMATGNKAIASTLSGMYGLGALFFGWVLSQAMGLNGIWWAMSATNVTALCVAFVMALIYRRRSRGRLKDLYLVPTSDDHDIASLSITANTTNAVAVASFVQSYLEQDEQLKDDACRIALAIEELTIKIAQVNDGKAEIDLRITHDDQTIISVRDNGIPYNPTKDKSIEEPESSLYVLRSISQEITYAQLLGFNRTLIII